MLCQNTGAYFIGGASGAVSEMRRQQRLLFRQQVALPLAVVHQAEKRQPHTRKSELPFHKNRRADVENLANCLCIIIRVP